MGITHPIFVFCDSCESVYKISRAISTYNKISIEGEVKLYRSIEDMDSFNNQKDSASWIFYSWTAFALSITMTTIGVVYLPVDNWVKGYFGMGLAFSVGSTLTLAKTQRDLHESKRIISRIDEAKVEQLLSQQNSVNR
jgi:hypothetical protein